MNAFNSDDHVLPRPVERLPEYPHAKARQALVERITSAFGLSSTSATAIANAVVDPSEVRKAIGEPSDPEFERLHVPGGTLMGIRTTVWARRIMPDPRNPRTLPSRRHPFAIEPGTGGEDSKFRPVPEPRSLDPDRPHLADLLVEVENREHLNWATQQAASFVLAENDWRVSIASQGVMEAVWLVATTYEHSDGSAPVTTLTTAEGSSRITAVHNLLSIRSSDVPYDDNEAKLRAHIRRLNDALDRGPDKNDHVLLRCERVPALILVGFRPHASTSTGFPTAVKSFVALRHVDPPKPWGEGPENESLADEVLDELYRRNLISDTQRDYYAGSCTRAEARAAHLPDDPVFRATQIVRLLTKDDERAKEAIRVAVTSQSTRKNVSQKLMNELATALILRAVADDPAKVDQIRRYLRHAFGKSVHRSPWESTGRTTDRLVAEALTEVRQSIALQNGEEPGSASLELAVRAAYALVVSGRLNADRGSANNEQPDRRTPGEVLDAMRRNVQGVHQLGQALRDFGDGVAIRAVDEDGKASDELAINDIYLRNEFPPPGRAKAARPGETPVDRYNNCLNAFESAAETLRQAFDNLAKVSGDDGRPLVDDRGVHPSVVARWRELLTQVTDEMIVWDRTYRKKYGNAGAATRHYHQADPELDNEADPYAGECCHDEGHENQDVAAESAPAT